jgi:hypothetical protein
MISYNKEYIKSGDGTHIGTTYSGSLTGTLQLPSGTSGITSLIALQDSLREAFSQEGKCLILTCDATVLLQVAPRITSISFSESNNNWVINMPYTITLEWDEEPSSGGEDGDLMPPYIQSITSDWNIEFLEDSNYHTWTLEDGGNTVDTIPYVARISQTCSAVGKRHYECTGTGAGLSSTGWEQARTWVLANLPATPTTAYVVQSGIINLDIDEMGFFNHTRSVVLNEHAGEISVAQSWLVFPSGLNGVPGNALEDYSVEIGSSIDGGTSSVSINGTINGLETRSYGSSPGDFTVTATKYDRALTYWNAMQSRLYWRAQKALENSGATIYNPLNLSALNTSLGHNPKAGTITYSYQYDTRPCNYVTGALIENITMDDQHPTDVIAEIVVPGRSRGPILQEISTVTAGSRSVSVDVVMAPTSGNCTSASTLFSSLISKDNAPVAQVEGLMCALETELVAAYSQVFKVSDTDNWQPKSSRYTRNVTWQFTNCSGTPPSTSFC